MFPITLNPDLLVSDLDRSVTFYSRALGFQELDRASAEGGGAFFAVLARDGARLMLETKASPDPGTKGLLERQGTSPRATVNFYVTVGELGAEERRLRAAGVEFSGPIAKPYGMKEVSFRDPDGYHWTVAQKV